MNNNKKENTMNELTYTLTLTATQLEELRGCFPSLADTAKKRPAPRSRAASVKLIPLPALKGLPPLKKMTVSEMDEAERNWNAECGTAAADVAIGKPSEAETTLRNLIAIHRSPWWRQGNTYRSTEHDYAVKKVASSWNSTGEWSVIDPEGNQVGAPFMLWSDAERAIEKRLAVA